MSVLYVGAFSSSLSSDASSSSTCGTTSVSGVSVHVSSSGSSNCRTLSTSGRDSFGVNSYGGSISASYIGAYSYSFSLGKADNRSRSSVEATRVVDFSIAIIDATIDDTMALSGERVAAPAHVKLSHSNTDTRFFCTSGTGGSSYGANVSCLSSRFARNPQTFRIVTFRRFTAAQSA